MKKLVLAVIAFAMFGFVSAQQTEVKKKKDWSKVALEGAGDHIMLQLGSDHWGGTPDSISSHFKGLARGLNLYVMMNKAFKSDPRWSVAFGLGVGSTNMYFSKMSADITASGSVLPFHNLDSANHFKKYKLATSYLEIPVELRYTFDPEHQKKSWKLALGAKIGTMLNAHTKGKNLQNSADAAIGNYTEKLTDKNFFNTTRIMGTARIGIGNFSLYGAYQLTSLLKDGAGASIKPFEFGLCISGL